MARRKPPARKQPAAAKPQTPDLLGDVVACSGPVRCRPLILAAVEGFTRRARQTEDVTLLLVGYQGAAQAVQAAAASAWTPDRYQKSSLRPCRAATSCSPPHVLGPMYCYGSAKSHSFPGVARVTELGATHLMSAGLQVDYTSRIQGLPLDPHRVLVSLVRVK